MSSDTFFMNSEIDIDSLPILFHFKPEKRSCCNCLFCNRLSKKLIILTQISLFSNQILSITFLSVKKKKKKKQILKLLTRECQIVNR